jgi:hypothetical protein
MDRRILATIAAAALCAFGSPVVSGGNLFVPNHSFETPSFPFPSPNVDSWQETPKPEWYDESGPRLWSQLTGTFPNQPPTEPDYIVNCDGFRAAWLFAEPEVGMFQDYDSVDWNDPTPTRAFNVSYEPGKSYQLTVGLFGGGAGGNGGMLLGVTLELSLYYRDANSNQVIVATTTITNSVELFTSNTNLVDFTVDVPVVQPGDAWVGQNIGILLLSTVTSNLHGGYWDLDNVRLTSTLAPVLANPALTNGLFQFTVQGEPGARCEIRATTNLNLPAANWPSLGQFTNTAGATTFIDTNSNLSQRFYQVVQSP